MKEKETCKFCKIKFKTSLTLSKHLSGRHGKKEFKCALCKKKEYSYKDYKNHYFESHSYLFLIENCNICKKKFPNIIEKNKHFFDIHNFNYCTYCEKTFSDEMNYHFCRKDLKSYECKFCKESNYLYTNQIDLAKHIFKNHFNEKELDHNFDNLKYIIDDCEKKFTVKDIQKDDIFKKDNLIIKDKYFLELYLHAKTHNNDYNLKLSKKNISDQLIKSKKIFKTKLVIEEN